MNISHVVVMVLARNNSSWTLVDTSYYVAVAPINYFTVDTSQSLALIYSVSA